MDHLTLPLNPVGPDLCVPYYGESDFDGEDLARFPTRKGWKLTFQTKGCIFERDNVTPSASEIEALLQQWLYFGLLHHTIGSSYRSVTWFRIGEGGHKRLDSSGLQELVASWSSDIVLVDDVTDLNPLRSRLQTAHRAILDVRATTQHIGLYHPELLSPQLVLAIAILGETLHQVIKDVGTIDAVSEVMKGVNTHFPPWRLATRTGRFDAGKPLIDFMEESSWCPADLARIRKTVDHVGTLYYMANLSPPKLYASHDSCMETACTATRIVPSTYKLSHANEGCNCDLVFTDHNKLASILTQGSLPLLHISTSNSPDGVLTDIRAHEANESFVALSHVWAEGLGNPFDNALHSCQLTRLSEMTAQMNPNGVALPLWIDTLCVPVGPQTLHELAMLHMREPYQQAAFVLVLDSYLSEVKAEDIDTMEIFGRLLCSTWTQRLWTLQEGRLGKEVYFRFADRVVNLRDQYLKTNFQRVPSQAHRSVQLDLIFSYDASRFADSLADYNGSITNTRRALRTRAVSVASDEALCVSCLMNIELDDIVAAPPEDRMATLWRKFNRVPVGMVFSRAQCKLATTGLRWAPESFLGFTPSTGEEDSWYGPNQHSKQVTAIPGERGLSVQLPGFMMHTTYTTRPDRITATLSESWQKTLSKALFIHDDHNNWWLLLREGQWTDKVKDPSDWAPSRMAVLLDAAMNPDVGRTRPPRSGSASTEHPFAIGSTCEGVLGFVHPVPSPRDNALLFEAEEHVSVSPLNSGFAAYLTAVQALAAEIIEHTQQDRTGDEEYWKQQAISILADNKGLRRLQNEFNEWNNFTDDKGHAELGGFLQLFAAVVDMFKVVYLPDDQPWVVD